MAAPERGDLIWLTFDPRVGREQAGRRPALVISPRAYNRKTSYCLVCPITSQVSDYPYSVVLPEGLPVSGAVLADQLKSMDRHVHTIEIVGKVPAETLELVTAKILTLVDPQGPHRFC